VFSTTLRRFGEKFGARSMSRGVALSFIFAFSYAAFSIGFTVSM